MELAYKEIKYWDSINKESWSTVFWNKNKPDHKHYEKWEISKFRSDIKMLYDSYIWKEIIKSHIVNIPDIYALELLPGTSYTIPLALHSLNYDNTLDRIDNRIHSNKSKEYFFEINNLCENVFQFRNYENYNLILGNHIFDDLLFYHHLDNCNIINKNEVELYSDYKLNAKTWIEIKDCINLNDHIRNITALFDHIINQISINSYLIFRQYPSTFSLKNSDLNQINIQLSLFYKLIKYLKLKNNLEVCLPNLDSIQVPLASKFPESFLVIKKLST